MVPIRVQRGVLLRIMSLSQLSIINPIIGLLIKEKVVFTSTTSITIIVAESLTVYSKVVHCQ